MLPQCLTGVRQILYIAGSGETQYLFCLIWDNNLGVSSAGISHPAEKEEF